ncbi:MAG: NAD(P)-binding domain-containing protein [Candidatus Omnitrophica bacterium]|nr:NAD(P)-binding domain-containing protein [Candidatus Omnitrophota bacterium]
MTDKKIGFIGSGRVTRILLGGFKRCGKYPENIVASDVDIGALDSLRRRFPWVETVRGDNSKSASQEIIILALHPPAIAGVLEEIRSFIKPRAMVISLAPKITIEKLSALLGGFGRVCRMIPNACSIVNAGYNPVAFSKALSESDKEIVESVFSVLGDCPVVSEEKLEAYAMLTAMGPTYFWFQWEELENIAESFGLSSIEAKDGLYKMVVGAAKAMYESGLSETEIMDLIPAKPLKEKEADIAAAYKSILGELYKKLKI